MNRFFITSHKYAKELYSHEAFAKSITSQILFAKYINSDFQSLTNIIMKKLVISLLLLVIIILAARFIFGGSEDDWICVDGAWVKHGNPSAEMPARPCK